MLISISAQSQQVLKGTVRDIQTNQPIPSAVIKIPGTSSSAVSTDYGTFELTYTESNLSRIIVSALGYESREVFIGDNSSEISVLLESSNLTTSEIQVKGFLIDKKKLDIPASIGIVTKQDIKRSNGINIQNSVNLLPGLDMQFRTIGSGARVIIRGYGDQTNFNGVGYKAYYNDVPLTDADGTTVLDDVDWTNLSKVEVFKGPISTIYGSGIAGVMSFKSDNSRLGTNFMQRGFRGSYGLWRMNTTAATGNDKLNLYANYGHEQYDGFRVHSNANQDFAIFNGNVFIDSKSTLSFFGNYSFSNTQLAGELDSLSFYNDPTEADTNYIKNDAHIKNESARLNASYERYFTKNLVNKTSFFTGVFYNDQPSAAGLTRANRNKFGGRTTFIYNPVIGKMQTNFILGGEYLKNINFAESYSLTNGQLGSLRGNQEIKPMTYNVFGQAEANITKTTLLTVGASINFIEYTVTDMIAQSSSHVNMSGYKKFDPIVAPRIAINQTFKDMVSFYGSFSTGFSPPSTNQILIPALGTVNYNLVPEKGISYELGSKGSLVDKTLNYELAVFLMNVKDKLVTQNFAAANGVPAYAITTNAGEVRYKGFEGSLSYSYVPPGSKIFSIIRPFINYTYNDFYNIDYKSNNNNDSLTKNYDGLKVPGTPPYYFNAGLDVETKQGPYAYLTYSVRGITPLTFDNSHNAASYGLLNAKIGFHKLFGKYVNLDLYAGADNLTGETYPIELFLNVNDLRFYLSAPNVATFYGGLNFQYLLN